MSQKSKIFRIRKNYSGYADKILRPLCAKTYLPIDMELSGMVDREKLWIYPEEAEKFRWN